MNAVDAVFIRIGCGVSHKRAIQQIAEEFGVDIRELSEDYAVAINIAAEAD